MTIQPICPGYPSHFRPPPLGLVEAPHILAGPRPATERYDQERLILLVETLSCTPRPIRLYTVVRVIPAAPLGLDVASLPLAGSRPATDRLDRELIPVQTERWVGCSSEDRLSDDHVMLIGRASPW